MKSIKSVNIKPGSDSSNEVKDIVTKEGTVILRNLITKSHAQKLEHQLVTALAEDNVKYGDGYIYNGMVHALMNRGSEFINLISLPSLLSIYRAILGHGCIIHAYNSSSMPPNKTNYSRAIHVDSPRLIPGYITNIGFTLALNPFTNENGAMEIYPDSFNMLHAPAEYIFDKEKVILDNVEVGDAILFNARCWHRGGNNTTQQWRHGVTMNICRNYMRQQFDYCKMLSDHTLKQLPEDVRKFLGYNVRMPENMEEFLLPPDERKYKPAQE